MEDVEFVNVFRMLAISSIQILIGVCNAAAVVKLDYFKYKSVFNKCQKFSHLYGLSLRIGL